MFPDFEKKKKKDHSWDPVVQPSWQVPAVVVTVALTNPLQAIKPHICEHSYTMLLFIPVPMETWCKNV